ncbi:MAG: hypothetical protein WA347_00845 [Rhabdochlamydiaceae bacterium]|jgi:hypothetical protein
MDNSFNIGPKAPFSLSMPTAPVLDRRKNFNFTLSHSLLSAKLTMDQKVNRRISDNIYQTLQKHTDAFRELEKIQFRKRSQIFLEMTSKKEQTALFSKKV